MADATTLETASPKQLGKQLRAVRRRKGLSLSEVARGAGLSRRELVNYERGKVEIPESDLWVLAGSCGVDVAELVPPTEALALTAAPSSMEDTITQLRSTQADAGLARHLDTLYALRALPAGSAVQLQEREREAMATALGTDPAAIESKLVDTMRVSKDEARRLRALIVPDAPRYTPLAIEAPEPEPMPQPEPLAVVPPISVPESEPPSEPAFSMPPSLSAFDAEVPTGNVDVFEELAKLPEPVALPDPGDDDLTDFLAPQPEPAAFANAGDAGLGGFAAWPSYRSALPDPATTSEATTDPILVDMQSSTPAAETTAYSAEHAPPIDVIGHAGGFGSPNASDGSGTDTLPTRETSWEPPPPIWDSTWTSTDSSPATSGPTDIVEFVDDYVTEAPTTNGGNGATGDDTASLWTTWNRAAFVDEAVDVDEVDEVVEDFGTPTSSETGPWDHQPDPAATSSGFYIDWGTETAETAATDTEAAAIDTEQATTAPTDSWEPTESWNGATAWDAAPDTETAPDLDEPAWHDDTATDDSIDNDEPALISWRPLADNVLAAVAIELATVATDESLDAGTDARTDGAFEAAPDTTLDATFDTTFDAAAEPTFDSTFGSPTDAAFDSPFDSLDERPLEGAFDAAPTFEPEPVEAFVTAGAEWDLGNAVPLVEVRGQGGLVMRRADERWALADVTTTPSFALEVDVDFRSGPGFGVLFHASTDANGHMSGYSFDVDPIHEGGSFLVRQWQADRELWNPIARVAAPDPAGMHGLLTLRVVVLGDHLAASVNGSTVLEVESLEQACAERNRQPASGDRVGIQAWSSSDLEIETLRVAPR